MAVIVKSDGVTVVEADAFTTSDPWVDHDDWACSTPELPASLLEMRSRATQ